MEEGRPSERPRLNLKPRDEAAAKQAEAERQKKLTHNPFGDAKPRETVLATRTGKSEEEILKENVRQERLRLRLNSQQTEEKETLEALVNEVKEQMDQEEEEGTRTALKALLTERQAAVEELMDKFAKQALDAAAKGEVQRPSERRALAGMQHAAPGGHHHHHAPGTHPVGSPGANNGGAHFGAAFERGGSGGYTGSHYRDGAGGHREGGYDQRGGGGGGSGRYHPTRGPPPPQGGYRDAAFGGEGREASRQYREAPAYERGGGRGGAGGGRPPYQQADRYIPADSDTSGGYRNGGLPGRGGFNGYRDSVEGRAPAEFMGGGRTGSGGRAASGGFNDDDDWLPGMPGVRAGGLDRGFDRPGFERPGFGGGVPQDRY